MRVPFILQLLLVCCFVYLLLFLAMGCTTTKEVHKSSITTDSTAIKELSDSLRLLKTEKASLEQLLREAEYASVQFDSTRCPQIIFPVGAAMLNKDSIQSLINELNSSINGLNNRVKTYADGTVEVTGRLKSVSYAKEKQSRLIIDYEKTIDSLKAVKQKEKVVVKTVVKEVDKRKKTKVLTMVLPWILLGYVIRWKQKSIINQFT